MQIWAHKVSQMSWIAMIFVFMLVSARLIDSFRWGTFTCDVAPMDKVEIERFSFWDRIYNYTAPNGGVGYQGGTYSFACDWVNELMYILQDVPLIFPWFATGWMLLFTLASYKGSWEIQKRLTKALPTYFTGWRVRQDLDTWGRIYHTVHVNARLDVPVLEEVYLKRRKVESIRNYYGSLIWQPDLKTSWVQAVWSETGPVFWLGMAPQVSAIYCRETGALSQVTETLSTKP